MRYKLILALVFCAAIAAGAVAAPRPGGLGTIGGQVLNASGKPVVGAHVTLQTTEGHHLQTVDTNEQGRFWFASLPEGQYSVRATYEDRVSEWRQGLWVAPGEQTSIVLHLRPKK
ncbi:MAG TPA: carboxypeptidase-like regulatory domain-containing protein [Candidatus Acidoferrales bacterium]|nr:carboxypeptidase-like regulatory domain-containing protein [Candidatus Acidoferrales bacterium]